MRSIAQSDKINWPNSNVIDAILESGELADFRNFYITSMTDMKEHMNLMQVEHRKYEESAEEVFQKIVDKDKGDRFSEIVKHLTGRGK